MKSKTNVTKDIKCNVRTILNIIIQHLTPKNSIDKNDIFLWTESMKIIELPHS